MEALLEDRLQFVLVQLFHDDAPDKVKFTPNTRNDFGDYQSGAAITRAGEFSAIAGSEIACLDLVKRAESFYKPFLNELVEKIEDEMDVRSSFLVSIEGTTIIRRRAGAYLDATIELAALQYRVN